MSHKNNDQTSQEDTGDTTFLSYADFFGELDASAAGAAEAGVGEVEGLPSGAALLVVRRGPNAGSRFLLEAARIRPGRLETRGEKRGRPTTPTVDVWPPSASLCSPPRGNGWSGHRSVARAVTGCGRDTCWSGRSRAHAADI
ncbi:hypothetical protein [Mycobacterium sp.]|uniref:hypothetical protein n=1 Tax=Mycobacterium sp. TaxID=1785 RepID=UPI003F99C4C5